MLKMFKSLVNSLVTRLGVRTDGGARLSLKRRYLELAERVAGVGHWRLDMEDQSVTWSEEVYRIHGVTREEFTPTLETAISFYHPDEVEGVNAAVAEAVANRTSIEFEKRIVRPNGEVRHVFSKGECEFSPSGELKSIFGIFQDITERVQADQRFRVQQERFELAIEGSNDGIWDWDLDTDGVYYTHRNFELLGCPRDGDANFVTWWTERVHPEDLPRVQDEIKAHLEDNQPYDTTYRIRHDDGSWRWWRSKGRAARDANGKPTRFLGSNSDVTDLKAAVARAETASQAKSAFLANMSHEIRTPMNSILGMAQVLQRSDMPEKQRRRVDLIADSGRALMHILNDILDLSKVEAGKMELENIPFSVADMMRSTEASFALKADEKGLAFSSEIDASARGEFMGDPTRLRQIVNNLLSNAIKFTERGSVHVRVQSQSLANQGQPCLHFTVTDTGPGLTEDAISKLFRPFSQADESVTRKHGGTGLGLAICQELCRLMGGKIWVESTPGKGALFKFTIPTQHSGAMVNASTAQSLRQNASSAWSASGSTSGPPSGSPVRTAVDAAYAAPSPSSSSPPAKQPHVEAPRAALARSGSASTPGLRILAAEDNPNNQLVLSAMLETIDHTLTFANNGQEALDAYATGQFDVILMDVRMPVMDGLTATRAIREAEKTNGRGPVPIIGLTAHVMSHHHEDCLNAGMDAVKTKPINEEALQAVLADVRAARDGDAQGLDTGFAG